MSRLKSLDYCLLRNSTELFTVTNSLLSTFDKIYIYNLHGNSKKRETLSDGSTDQNVFDITQGVSINIFIKKGDKLRGLAELFYYDKLGKREDKYTTLRDDDLTSIEWQKLKPSAPNYFFVPKDFKEEEQYNTGFSITDLFVVNSSGLNTLHDKLVISFDRPSLCNMVDDAIDNTLPIEEFRKKYQIKDSRDWKLKECLHCVRNGEYSSFKNKIVQCLYRPFDYRWIILDDTFVGYPRWETTKHFLFDGALGLATTRQTTKSISALVSKVLFGQHKIVDPYDRSYVFPLYVYTELDESSLFNDKQLSRKPNLRTEIIAKIGHQLGCTFIPEKKDVDNTFAPIDILDYIYAVLHSPTYRETYKEFLKIDFPRIPYPKDQETFWQLVKFGGELRQLHLLESPKVEAFITSYPQDGDNTITRNITQKDYEITDKENQTGRVWINDMQYFDNVPQIAWEFYIGGYQPAQKWLKDRHGRTLNFDDILHYQKIIVALTETDRIMKEIDMVDFME